MPRPRERVHRGNQERVHGGGTPDLAHGGIRERVHAGAQDRLYGGSQSQVHRRTRERMHRGAPLTLSWGVLLLSVGFLRATASEPASAAPGCSRCGLPVAHPETPTVRLQVTGQGHSQEHTQRGSQGHTQGHRQGHNQGHSQGQIQGFSPQGHTRGTQSPALAEPGWAASLLRAARILLEQGQGELRKPDRNPSGSGSGTGARAGAGADTRAGRILVPSASSPSPRVPDPELLPSLPTASLNKCGANPFRRLQAQEVSDPPHLPWVPVRGRYLLPLCHYGRLSNQQLCMRMYFRFAALLNRTLVIPRLGFKDGVPEYSYKWKWDDFLDVPGMRRCLSGDADARLTSAEGGDASGDASGAVSERGPHVVTLDELLEAQGRECLRVDHLVWFGPFNRVEPRGPGLCEGFSGSFEMLDAGTPRYATVSWQHIDRVRALQQPVISLGSLFFEKLPKGMDARAPVAPFDLQKGCGDLWAAPPVVLSLVSRIGEAISAGKPYAAMHLRRGDFSRAHKESFHSISQVAEALLPWLSPLQVSLLYVATDASPLEIGELEALLGARTGMDLRVVSMHQLVGQWRRDLERIDSLHSGLVLALVEKYLCASGAAFLGTAKSTFSEDILRIRIATSQASCWDRILA